MRSKSLWAGVLLLVCSILCALFLPFDVLPLTKTSPRIALGEDGTVYLTSNDAKYSRIIAVDQDDTVRYCYQEKSRGENSASSIGPVAVDGSLVYFIRELGARDEVIFSRWELVCYDPAALTATVLLEDGKLGQQVSDIAVSGGTVSISCIGMGTRGDTIELYQFDLDNPENGINAVTSADAPDGKAVLSVVHGGGNTVCALLSDGSLINVSGREIEAVHMPEGCGPVSYLSATNGYIWAQSAARATFMTGTASYLRLRECDRNALSGAAVSSQLVMRTPTDPVGSVVLVRSVGEDMEPCSRLNVPLGIRMQLRWKTMLAVFCAVLVLMLLVVLVFRVFSGNKLANSLIAAAVALTALLFVALSATVIIAMIQARNDENESEAAWYAQNAAFRLQNNADYTELGLTLPNGRQMGSLFKSQQATGGASVQLAAFSERKDGLHLAYASCGQIAADPVLQLKVDDAWFRGRISTGRTDINGRRTILCAAPIRQSGAVTGVTVCLVTTLDLIDLLGEPLQLFVLCAVLLFIVCLLLFTALFRSRLRPLGPIVKQMDKLAVGDTVLDEVKCADDEIGAIWRSLKELSVGVAIRDYETAMTLAACRRFVPQGLEHLLNRSSITEVSFGDLTVADGTIGLVSVNNSTRMRETLDDRAFMDYVGKCFLTISQSIRPCGGMLLTGGFDLDAIRILFPEEPDKGVSAFLSLLGEVQSEESSNLDCFTLLHNTRFLYGVAGAEDEAFPYLASAEISFFTSRLPLFAELGCRLVVTDAFLTTLKDTYSTRYIGFFSSTEGRVLCKLYEILDCYGEMERTTREKYDGRFQEAIRCFYHNDFYLARNLFLAILRLCPGDGVARWYLFACEHYFNAGAGEEARYDLFGIRDLLN